MYRLYFGKNSSYSNFLFSSNSVVYKVKDVTSRFTIEEAMQTQKLKNVKFDKSSSMSIFWQGMQNANNFNSYNPEQFEKDVITRKLPVNNISIFQESENTVITDNDALSFIKELATKDVGLSSEDKKDEDTLLKSIFTSFHQYGLIMSPEALVKNIIQPKYFHSMEHYDNKLSVNTDLMINILNNNQRIEIEINLNIKSPNSDTEDQVIKIKYNYVLADDMKSFTGSLDEVAIEQKTGNITNLEFLGLTYNALERLCLIIVDMFKKHFLGAYNQEADVSFPDNCTKSVMKNK